MFKRIKTLFLEQLTKQSWWRWQSPCFDGSQC